MTSDPRIPPGVTEVFLGEDGQPIAFTPPGYPTMADIHRGAFLASMKDGLAPLFEKARRRMTEDDIPRAVICLDVEDPVWRPIVDDLMPGHDWASIRAQGMHPIARGVVSREIAEQVVAMCPSAGKLPPGLHLVLCAAGGLCILAAAEVPGVR